MSNPDNPTGISKTKTGAIVATGPGVIVYKFHATQYALKLRANGIMVTSKFPTVKALCKAWNVKPAVRTFAQLYEVFRNRETLWKEHNCQHLEILTHGKVPDGK